MVKRSIFKTAETFFSNSYSTIFTMIVFSYFPKQQAENGVYVLEKSVAKTRLQKENLIRDLEKFSHFIEFTSM